MRHLYSGKVRELYETGDGVLLLVATDRISAFDHVLETSIPDKGKILTQLSLWWFDRLADVAANHLVDAPIPAEFAGRAMACRRLEMVPVECVARGYLTGSALADYRQTGGICGLTLPPGLGDGSMLPGPVFTPATKAPPSWSGSPWRSTGGAPRSPPGAASSSPTPRSSSVSTPAARCCLPTRC